MVYTAVPTQMAMAPRSVTAVAAGLAERKLIAYAKSQFTIPKSAGAAACSLAKAGITKEIGIVTADTSVAAGYGAWALGLKDPVAVSLTPTSLTQLHSET